MLHFLLDFGALLLMRRWYLLVFVVHLFVDLSFQLVVEITHN